MMVLLDLSSLADVFDILYLVFTILIFVLGFYVYFKKEKDQKTLLIALGFLFFFLAALASWTLGGNVVLGFLNTDILTPWSLFFNFLGALVVLIAVEPWKAFSK